MKKHEMEYLEQLQRLYELQEIYDDINDYYGDCEYLQIEEDWLVQGFILMFNERFNLFNKINAERQKYYAVFDDKKLYDIVSDHDLGKAIPAILNTKYFSRDVFTGSTKLNKKNVRVLNADMLRQVLEGVKTVEDFDDIHELVYANPKAEYQRENQKKKVKLVKPVKPVIVKPVKPVKPVKNNIEDFDDSCVIDYCENFEYPYISVFDNKNKKATEKTVKIKPVKPVKIKPVKPVKIKPTKPEKIKTVKTEKKLIKKRWMFRVIDDNGIVIACGTKEYFEEKGVNMRNLSGKKICDDNFRKYWGYFWKKIEYDDNLLLMPDKFVVKRAKPLYKNSSGEKISVKKIDSAGTEEINTLNFFSGQGYSRKSIIRAIANKKNYKTYKGCKWEYV